MSLFVFLLLLKLQSNNKSSRTTFESFQPKKDKIYVIAFGLFWLCGKQIFSENDDAENQKQLQISILRSDLLKRNEASTCCGRERNKKTIFKFYKTDII